METESENLNTESDYFKNNNLETKFEENKHILAVN